MMKNALPAVLAITAILCTSCNTSVSDERGLRIIALAKLATGGKAWDEIEIWHERGQAISVSGETSHYEHWGDLRSLRTLNVNASRSHYMVFDGREAYTCENPGCELRREIAPNVIKSGAYQVAFGFFFTDRFPASIRYQRSQIEHGVLFDVVNVAPAGLDSFDVWVDQNTHLIYRLVSSGGHQTDLFDYRKVGGVVVPFADKSQGTTIRTDMVSFEPSGSITFAAPSPTTDTEIR